MVKNKMVILRSDFNVPIINEVIQDKNKDKLIFLYSKFIKKTGKSFNNFSPEDLKTGMIQTFL